MSAEGLPSAEKETSVRDDLLSAFAEMKAREAKPETPSADTPAATPAAATPETPETAQGQARDPAGKFAKTEETPAAAAEGAAAPAAQEPAKPAVKAPDGWSAEMKAVFGTLDPKVQAEISRRESELTRKITSVDDERTFGRKVKEAAQPYAAIMASEGATVDQAFGSFLNYNFIMRQGTPQQKVQAILNVARIFNVPLQQALQQPQQFVAQNPAIESLESRLNRIEQQRQADERNRQLQEEAQNQEEIDRFGADPAHPHFETVKALMGSLIVNGAAKSLPEAYEQACLAHPEIGPTLISARVAEEQKKRVTQAEAARRAAGSVVGGPGGARPQAQTPSSTGSIRDDIKAAMAQVQGARV